jgi:hypothetical protein
LQPKPENIGAANQWGQEDDRNRTERQPPSTARFDFEQLRRAGRPALRSGLTLFHRGDCKSWLELNTFMTEKINAGHSKASGLDVWSACVFSAALLTHFWA